MTMDGKEGGKTLEARPFEVGFLEASGEPR